jgi:hypothetical protein
VVTSRDGIKNTYTIFFTGKGIPTITHNFSEPCEETGTEIIVNLNLDAVSPIQQAARKVFFFTPVLPEIQDADFVPEHISTTKWDIETEEFYIQFNNNKIASIGYICIDSQNLLSDLDSCFRSSQKYVQGLAFCFKSNPKNP